MRPGETGQGRLPFMGLGIVFHGAGSEGIHARVHPVVPLGESGIVAHHIHLTQVGEIGAFSSEGIVDRGDRNIPLRHGKPDPSLPSLLPKKGFVHNQSGGSDRFFHDRTSLMRASISSLRTVSVAQKR